MRVVGAEGEQLGVLTIEAALAKAGELGMDLVEVNPMAKPPVCKIMDYGKFKYEEKKKASDAKRKQIVVHLKEVKLRPKTEDHDYDFKVRNVKRFLEEGNKARITIMFRGREITHKELGQKLLDDVVKDVKDIGVIEQHPRMEGRQMFMILAPTARILQKVRDEVRRQAAAAAAHSGPPPSKKEGESKAAAAPAPASAPTPEPAAASEVAEAAQAPKQESPAEAGRPAEG